MRKNTKQALVESIMAKIAPIVKESLQDERTYTISNLSNILRDMADYVDDDCADLDELKEYFSEIVNTGLFHDAEGKIIEQTDTSVTITTEY